MCFLSTKPQPKLPTTHASLLSSVVDAYTNLTRDQLVLFLSIRHLPVDGSSLDLAKRLAEHDLESYSTSPVVQSFPGPPEVAPEHPPPPPIAKPSKLPTLPAELLADIMDCMGDWELAKAVGTVTSLKAPKEWDRASSADLSALVGSTKFDFSALTATGANAIVRLCYTHILDLLKSHDPTSFDRLYGGIHSRLIPFRASCSGRTEVLTWWKEQHEIPKDYGDDCIDEACRHGQIEVLEWWKRHSSTLPLQYTEAALENASARGHIHVLEWWKQSGLSLKVGRVMDLASKAGQVEVLDWWLHSGIEVNYDNGTLEHASRNGRLNVLTWWLHSGYQMMYNEDVLIGATRHNRPEVLQWWYDSGLPIHYRICDIEEAVEDAIRQGSGAKEWWMKLGVDFNANNIEWVQLKLLR
ncbi:uncharacterized protein EI90DRAFT_2945421 [Cantharellus anzutake]|uniref:uncharacterized protein n=1 Tax=Cantharellus anzutake TaxID=1750568 RepID=UPI001904F8DE|nr:uncharacterized protein EI90DRAFT_2945421 [Cantharellus anzutake]KAF8316213.1 hypothetical protein EI90DRAFT_2945421 [Cantharellus anzutake]